MYQKLKDFLDRLIAWVQKNPDRAAVLFLVVFSCFFIFKDLGQASLIDWDESIYASVAKEILQTGDWLTLHWNKDIWFEKPPLYFWLTAFTYSIFGINEFAARFWSALSGVVGIVAVYFFGKEMFNRLAGFVSAAILASTVHWVLQSRNGTLDVPTATFIILALYFFWKARENFHFWKFSGIFLGLTFMTKSVVVVIPLLVMLVFAMLEIFYERSFKRYPLKGILLFTIYCLLITVPWHLLMYQIHGRGFIDEYFFYHVLSRTRGIEGHNQPWFWYFTVVQHWGRHWYLLFLGAIYLLAGLLVRDGVRMHWGRFFLFLWFFFTLVIFSASRSKIEWYIVPIYPTVALLIGGILPLSLSYLTLTRKFWGTVFLVVVCTTSLLRWTHLWKISDYNRSVAEASKAMREISSLDDKLLVANIAPGPPVFYSDRKVVTIDWWGLRKKVLDGGRLFVLTPEELFRNLEGEGLTSSVEVFRIEGGVALYGWR